MTITKLAVGPMDNNAYLLRCAVSGEALLVDAAAEPVRLAELGRADGPPPTTVVTTHRHRDHCQALAAVVADTGAETLAGDADAAFLPVPVDRRLHHGDTVEVGAARLEVIALRGHTPGSVALLYREPDGIAHLFTGDSLFPGGPGRTTSPADFTSLMDDLEARVFGPLPDSTWVYPGHGADTTLGAERPHLGEWRSRGW
ncbi:MAG: MBL fold metallo-hydrolase [bacterium]